MSYISRENPEIFFKKERKKEKEEEKANERRKVKTAS